MSMFFEKFWKVGKLAVSKLKIGKSRKSLINTGFLRVWKIWRKTGYIIYKGFFPSKPADAIM